MYPCRTLRHECRYYHGCTGPKVSSFHIGTVDLLHTVDIGISSVDIDIRTHAVQLGNMVESAFKKVFGDNARTVGSCKHAGHGLLQIGRETGVRHGLDYNSLGTLIGPDLHIEIIAVIASYDLSSAFDELCRK